MKKVWILERLIDKAGMEETLNDFRKMRDQAAEQGKEDVCKSFDEAIKGLEKRINENPNGYWLGYVGRTIYKQFCFDAKEELRFWIRDRKESSNNFRVVEGQIEDNAKEWTGYKVVKVNDGVRRYLLATM